MLLRVERETAGVDAAVEVRRQLRDAQQRPVDAHQDGAAVDQRQPTGQPEIAVQPGVPQRTAVDLDPEQLPPGPVEVGLRLDPQVRAVGVGADDPERIGRTGVVGDVPGVQ